MSDSGGQVAGEPFLRATFHGRRFDGGRLPLKVVADLAALNDLVAELGRVRYLEANPARRRLPRGYRSTTTLWISELTAGSAAATLDRTPPRNAPLDQLTDPMEAAREEVLDVLNLASQSLVLPISFPAWARQSFNKIGRGLEDSEYVELFSPVTNRVARLDHDIRRRIVEEVAPFEDDYTAVGSIQAFGSPGHTFTVITPDGPVDGTFPEELDAPLRLAIGQGEPTAKYLSGSVPYRVDGTAQFKGDRMVGFVAEDVVPVEFVDGGIESVMARVRDLLSLEAGWLDEGADPVDHDLAEEFLRVLVGVADREQPKPAVFPTEDGGLRAEWQVGGHEVIWEPSVDGRHFVLSRRLRTTSYQEHELPPGLSASDVAEHLAAVLSGLDQDGQ